MKKPELLAPAGNMEKLEVAVHYGADAVYLSGKSYGLRSFAGNFTLPQMEDGIRIAHGKGVKVYVTVNTFFRNQDLKNLPDYLVDLQNSGVDAIIVSDPGVISIAREKVPQVTLHLSTQSNTTNWRSVQFWKEQGISRVNLARELPLAEIECIGRKVEIETEVFVHGAMCISYSGRCLLSNYLSHRDSNRGECSQPCRWKYSLMEETRPGVYMPIFEDGQTSYILSSKDLCLIEHIPTLIQAGIDAFKIEGRMKGIHYVGNVVRVYRRAIDEYINDPDTYVFKAEWLNELKKLSHRGYTTGFFCEEPSSGRQNYSCNSYVQTHDLVGVVKEVLENNEVKTEIRNQVKVGDELEFISRSGELHHLLLKDMRDEENNHIQIAQPNQFVILCVDFPTHKHDLIRRQK